MIDSGNDPVEISIHFGPDGWTEKGLADLVSSYQGKLRAMGAPAEEIVTQIDKREGGSGSIRVSWDRRGTSGPAMTGGDASGRVVPEGNEPGLTRYTEESGETYMETAEQPPTAVPYPAERTNQTELATRPGELSAVPWTWLVGIATSVVLTVGGVSWIWRKTCGTKTRKGRNRDAH